mmetsp:Transcript_3148/g.9630  ORF Transcript_3148/g.9630 Transcript_3148/m.9630 type:complete len:93 (+) Transcript_3148:5298-5576(+)|eukprot:scaffold224224_cov28-Tisochrysis_lutea.AAC.9
MPNRPPKNDAAKPAAPPVEGDVPEGEAGRGGERFWPCNCASGDAPTMGDGLIAGERAWLLLVRLPHLELGLEAGRLPPRLGALRVLERHESF